MGPDLGEASVNAAGDIASFGGPGAPHASRSASSMHIVATGPARLRGRARRSHRHVRHLRARCPPSSIRTPGGQLTRSWPRRASLAPSLGLADALATALAVAGDDGLQMVAALEGYEALAIGFDATWRWTAQFPFGPPTPPSERAASVGTPVPWGYVHVSSSQP